MSSEKHPRDAEGCTSNTITHQWSVSSTCEKETAALYAGKSEDIKAKVKEYIHAQKEECGKEKAEP
jgi:hypothetical protein